MNGAPTYSSFEQVRNVIVNDSILSPQCKTQLIEYASDQSAAHIGLGVTFAEALQYVFTRIDVNENGNEIKRILNQEMSDALCMCFIIRKLILNSYILISFIYCSMNSKYTFLYLAAMAIQ